MTESLSRTQAVTHADVRDVLWKIRTDLTQLRRHYGAFDAQYESTLSGDLFSWIYSGYVDAIEFVFYEPASQVRRLALRYVINRGGTYSTNDDAGRVPPWANVSSTHFTALVTYSTTWQQATDAQRSAFYASLQQAWGPSMLRLADGASWTTDKRYTSGSLSTQRLVHVA